MAALMPEDFKYQDQERNEPFLEKVLGFVQNWRLKYVLKDVQPPPMAKDDKLVNSLLPEAVEEMVVLPASMAIMAHQDRELQKLEAAVKKRRGAIRTALKAVMGPSMFADAGEGCYLKRVSSTVHITAKPAYDQERTMLYSSKKEPKGVKPVGPHDGVDIAAVAESLGIASVLDSAPDVETLELKPEPKVKEVTA